MNHSVPNTFFNGAAKTVLLLMWLVLLLLPFGRLSELPVLLLTGMGLFVLIKHRRKLFQSVAFTSYSSVFILYFLMMLLSSVDSFWPEKSWLITFGAWRFYFAGLAVLHFWPQDKSQAWNWSMMAVAGLVLFWSVDALIQYVWGRDVFGIESYQGRLSGIFGMNVKLGPVLALLLSFALQFLKNQQSWLRYFAIILMLLVILLSGTRSAWLMAAFVMLFYGWHQGKGKRLKLLMQAIIFMGVSTVLLWQFSPDFQQRIERSAAVFQGDSAGIDYALADRLPIWHAAWEMFKAHPVNGVGPRAFRKAYPEFAASDDVWLAQNTQGLHAHHWFLELLSETGVLGLLLFFAMAIILIKMVKQSTSQTSAWAPVVAITAAFLPVVSLYSLFSSFWSLCLWWVITMLFVAVKND